MPGLLRGDQLLAHHPDRVRELHRPGFQHHLGPVGHATPLSPETSPDRGAVQGVEAVRAQTAESIARIAAETEAVVAEQQARAAQAVANQTAAREELDRVRAQAAEQVTAARAEAEQHRREVEAERDRVLAEQAAGGRRRGYHDGSRSGTSRPDARMASGDRNGVSCQISDREPHDRRR